MVEYHPFDETIWDEPFEVYRRLRDEAPAYYLGEFDCWFLSRFEDIWGLATRPKNLSSERGTTTKRSRSASRTPAPTRACTSRRRATSAASTQMRWSFASATTMAMAKNSGFRFRWTSLL